MAFVLSIGQPRPPFLRFIHMSIQDAYYIEPWREVMDVHVPPLAVVDIVATSLLAPCRRERVAVPACRAFTLLRRSSYRSRKHCSSSPLFDSTLARDSFGALMNGGLRDTARWK